MQQVKHRENQTKKEKDKMKNQLAMQVSESIKKDKGVLEFSPIVEDGFENIKDVEIHQDKFYEWFGNRYQICDAYYIYSGHGFGSEYEIKGVRVLYSQEFTDQMGEGKMDLSTEVYLMDDEKFMRFHTFRKIYFCSNCQQHHVIVHRMIAKDQMLSDEEQNALSNNIPAFKLKNSKLELTKEIYNEKMETPLTLNQNKVLNGVKELWLPPIFEDGTDLKGLYDHQVCNLEEDGEPQWTKLELTDAGVTFPLSGLRVCYTPGIKHQTINGHTEISTEVFLTNEGKLLKFLTFRDTTVYQNNDTRTHFHRTVAKDQTLNSVELDEIMNNISIYLENLNHPLNIPSNHL